MPSAACGLGAVLDADLPAYEYDVVENLKEKVTIRFGIQCVMRRFGLTIDSNAVRARQQLWVVSYKAADYHAARVQ